MLGDRSAVCLSADATPTPRLVPIRYSCLLLVGKRRTSPLRSWHGEVSKNVQRAHRVTRLICHSDTTCTKGRCRHKEQWAALLNCELPRLPQNLESQGAGPSPTSPGCSVGPPTRSLSSECLTPCQGFVFSLLICFWCARRHGPLFRMDSGSLAFPWALCRTSTAQSPGMVRTEKET